MLIAELLHDTVEYTDTAAADLIREFGQDIASVVLEVTDDISLPRSERERQQIERARNINDGAKLVKLADKICNLRSPTARRLNGRLSASRRISTLRAKSS